MRPRLSKVAAEGYFRRHKPDYSLVVITSMLLIFGSIVLYTVSPALEQSELVYRQLGHIILAGGAFALAAVLPLSIWRSLQIPILIAAIVSSILLLVPSLALSVNGATRWIDLGWFSFQPAELLKFSLVIYLSVWLSERHRTQRLDDGHDTLIPLLIITGALGVFVAILQRDMGTMISVLGIICTMLFVSGMQLKQFGIYIATVLSAGAIAIAAFPHRMARFTTFLNPGQDVEGTGYHINQALIAIGSGGWFGQGLGKSVQVFGYLPEAISDSVFAIIAEQFGFAGSVLVIFLYGALAVRLLRLIERAPNMYMRLLVAGVFGWLVSHVIINVGSIIGVMPLTGITLPFLSLGGTSLMFMSASFGIAFNISRYTSLAYNQKEKHEGLVSRRRNRRSRAAAFGARV